MFWKIAQRYAKLSYKMWRRKRLPRYSSGQKWEEHASVLEWPRDVLWSTPKCWNKLIKNSSNSGFCCCTTSQDANQTSKYSLLGNHRKSLLLLKYRWVHSDTSKICYCLRCHSIENEPRRSVKFLKTDEYIPSGGFKYFLFSPLPGDMIQFD